MRHRGEIGRVGLDQQPVLGYQPRGLAQRVGIFERDDAGSICTMIMGGTFDRHPKLKVLSVENDASWPALERMDCHYFRDQAWAGAGGITSGRTPSQIFHDQVICTFMRDKTAVRFRDIIGTRNMMWGSDFPHYDATWPESIPTLEEHFPAVPLEDQKRIARRNVIELYGLPLEP